MTPTGFTGAGIDRADHLRLDPERVAALAASPGARLLLLDGHDPVLDDAGALDWSPMPADGDALILLGLEEGEARFARIAPVRTGALAWSLFALVNRMRPRDAALWGTARALIEWHNRHGFCGVCGHVTTPFRSGWGRRCGGCGAEHFPRVDPVVIMLAEHGGQVLVGRQPRYPAGRYSALAGFVEPGEAIEEAVARELHEEAGVRATAVRYVASQPWPFPGQLMIACIAAVDGPALTLDTDELEDAKWVDQAGVRAALAGEPGAPVSAPPPYAIAHTLLAHWAADER